MNRQLFNKKWKHTQANSAELDRKWRAHLREQEEQMLMEALRSSTTQSTPGGGGSGSPVPNELNLTYEILVPGQGKGADYARFVITASPGTNYTFDWGDGNSTILVADGSAQLISHNYNSIGTYSVKLQGDLDAVAGLEVSGKHTDANTATFAAFTTLTALSIFDGRGASSYDCTNFPTTLTALIFAGVPVTEFSCESLPSLQTLTLNNLDLNETNFSINLPALTLLDLRGNEFTNVDFLGDLASTVAMSFSGNPIVTVNWPTATALLQRPDGELNFNGFWGCLALEEVNAPALLSAGRRCFAECPALSTVNLPSLLTAGQGLFENCDGLSTISLPALTVGGSFIFYACDALTTVDLPLCTSIGEYAFTNCESLASVNLPACTDLGGTVLANFVFVGVPASTMVLNINASRATCNAGGPDGDLVGLSNVNYV